MEKCQKLSNRLVSHIPFLFCSVSSVGTKFVWSVGFPYKLLLVSFPYKSAKNLPDNGELSYILNKEI